MDNALYFIYDTLLVLEILTFLFFLSKLFPNKEEVENGTIMMSRKGLHELPMVTSGITQKSFWIKALKIARSLKKAYEHIWQPEKGLATSSRSCLFFILISIKRDWFQKQKWSYIKKYIISKRVSWKHWPYF